MQQPFDPPAFDIPRLRGLLAERQIRHTEFARACGLSRVWTSRVLSGHPAGELGRIKLARGIAALGLDREVQRAAS